MSKKYGNDHAWCFVEDGWDPNQSIEVWHSIGEGQEEVMAHATDRYNATAIVDALIISENVSASPANKLSKKEIVFLQFVASNCLEPWCTMASNSIMWNDRPVYEKLKSKFPEIY